MGLGVLGLGGFGWVSGLRVAIISCASSLRASNPKTPQPPKVPTCVGDIGRAGLKSLHASFRVLGLGFRVSGFGFRVQGLGVKV